ncbi:glycosyltransferase family 2 protein [Pisciglobus halotolerans]|uniref:4,4'-diaponeurosporenoate glycosyltransferase n=1 Tax=Pisciglobus halotolerans TaxID=745365 RepID=A0A1I3ARJ6_9LACT|nr:glycosyltransferase [Pisciglobus halotolerans]SFH51981.1 4,4'-diaponeurosporenoate glycosyltransferase [Pisciglobus halotolerans]
MLIGSLAVILLAWSLGWLAFWRVPFLPRKVVQKRTECTISVVIPTRNEEYNLPRLLSSLKQQRLQPKEIIVSDDDSEDATVAIARQFNAMVVVKPMDERAVGKAAGCWRGAKAATGEVLLFLDADTYLERADSLEHLVHAYQKQGQTGILSVQPYHQVAAAYEQFSAVFNILVLAGMNAFTLFKSYFKPAGAFGPCLFCSKAEYMMVGGHEKAQEDIMEDFVLGNSFQKKGLPIVLYAGKGAVHFCMYPEGMRQLVEGWTKNFAIASRSTHPLVLFCIICWISGGTISGGFLAAALFVGSVQWLIGAAVMYVLYFLQCYLFAKRVGSFSLWALLIYPFLFVFFILLFSWSFFKTHFFRTVTWKGRNIKL